MVSDKNICQSKSRGRDWHRVDGASAGAEFYRIHFEEVPEEEQQQQVREQLLEYCRMDTMAMQRICKALLKI
tara:strand:- start:114 stop:329 length:216 start_codon:yes stop_codon:yes gene_type:complete